MRLSLRFIVPLLVALGLFAYAAVPLVEAVLDSAERLRLRARRRASC